MTPGGVSTVTLQHLVTGLLFIFFLSCSFFSLFFKSLFSSDKFLILFFSQILTDVSFLQVGGWGERLSIMSEGRSSVRRTSWWVPHAWSTHNPALGLGWDFQPTLIVYGSLFKSFLVVFKWLFSVIRQHVFGSLSRFQSATRARSVFFLLVVV